MRKLLGKTLLISTFIMALLSTTVLGAGEKSLVKDSEDFLMSYGYATKLTEKGDKEIIEAIRRTGKTDFKEGFYAEFRPSELFRPPFSEQYLVLDHIKGYDKLVFDVCVLSQENFGDLEALIYWQINKIEFQEHYPDFDSFKKDFKLSKGVKDEFNIVKIKDGLFPDPEGVARILIADGSWNYKYAIIASNQWETVELDIRDLDGLIFYFSISDTASMLVANPMLISTSSEKPVGSPEKLKAVPTNSKVFVNGQAIEFDAYKINNNNYFKLRDLAKVLTGTEKQFEVTWDGVNKAINLISNKPYTIVGGELSKGEGSVKEAVESTATIYKDGVIIDLKAYTINDNNYFKLRDIGEAFDFGVIWDPKTNSIIIDTSIGYTLE